MSREIDPRNPSINRAMPLREIELHERAPVTSDRLPGAHRVRVAGLDANTRQPGRDHLGERAGRGGQLCSACE